MLGSRNFSKLSTQSSDIARPLVEAELNHEPTGAHLLLERPKNTEAEPDCSPACIGARGGSCLERSFCCIQDSASKTACLGDNRMAPRICSQTAGWCLCSIPLPETQHCPALQPICMYTRAGPPHQGWVQSLLQSRPWRLTCRACVSMSVHMCVQMLFMVLSPCSLCLAQDSSQPLGWQHHGPESSLKQARSR